MKKLENFHWKPHWVSHLGCILACKDYLGMAVSDAAVFGGTGHAFVINIHHELCPSGPTAWKSEMIFENIKNLGLEISGHFCWQSEGEDKFYQAQQETWEMVRRSIDENLPCYCWYLDEYAIIDGYDETGYYLKGPGNEAGVGPVSWQKLGKEGVAFLEAYHVSKTGKRPSAEDIVRDAFQAAAAHANNLKGWIFDDYRSGVEAYDWWIAALEQGKAGAFGNGYNAQVWCECRAYAVEFLEEFVEKLSGQKGALTREALRHYHIVSEQLTRVAQLYPFDPSTGETTCPVDKTSEKAVEALKIARTAEGKALAVVEEYIRG